MSGARRCHPHHSHDAQLPTPKLGEERWSQLLTFTAGGRSSVVKQTAVRTETVVVVVSGSAALVDVHVAKAVDKAHGAGWVCLFGAIA